MSKAASLAIGRFLGEMGGPTGPSIVDASVVISAATRGDDIYTGDEDDLNRVAVTLGLEKDVRIFGLDG